MHSRKLDLTEQFGRTVIRMMRLVTIGVSAAIATLAIQPATADMSSTTWGPATNLSTVGYDVTFPAVATSDDASRAVSLFTHDLGSSSGQTLASSYSDGGWEQHAVGVPAWPIGNQRVAMSADGAGAIGVQNAGTVNGYAVIASTVWDGDSWSGPIIRTATNANADGPALAGSDTMSSGTMAYLSGPLGSRTLNFVRWSGGTWTSPSPLSGSGAFPPSIDVSGDGARTVLAWRQVVLGQSFIQTRTLNNTTASATSVIASGVNEVEPRVSASTDGLTAFVVWLEPSGANRLIRSSRLSGGTWSPPVTVSTAGPSAGPPRILTSADGSRAVAAWVDGNTVRSATWQGSWGAADTVFDEGTTVSGLEIAGSQDVSVVTAIWTGLLDSFWRIRSSTKAAGVWSPPATLSKALTNGVGANIDSSADGLKTVAVWHEGISGQPKTVRSARATTSVTPDPKPDPTTPAVPDPAPPATTTISGWPKRIQAKKRKVTVKASVTPGLSRQVLLQSKKCQKRKCRWRTVKSKNTGPQATATVRFTMKAVPGRRYRLSVPATSTATAAEGRAAKVVAAKRR
jgi:hypothetical protein